jgi:hypothetical protein
MILPYLVSRIPDPIKVAGQGEGERAVLGPSEGITRLLLIMMGESSKDAFVVRPRRVSNMKMGEVSKEGGRVIRFTYRASGLFHQRRGWEDILLSLGFGELGTKS